MLNTSASIALLFGLFILPAVLVVMTLNSAIPALVAVSAILSRLVC